MGHLAKTNASRAGTLSMQSFQTVVCLDGLLGQRGRGCACVCGGGGGGRGWGCWIVNILKYHSLTHNIQGPSQLLDL